jgi:hypothetical protein
VRPRFPRQDVGDSCPKCGTRVEQADNFCRSCGRPFVFVEMAVWKQFLLAIGTIFALVLALGGIVAAVEGFDSEVEQIVVEAAGGWDEVESVDCSEQGERRHRCEVKLDSGGCELWAVDLATDRGFEGVFRGRSEDC